MARIRSIKPEFWTDEKVVGLSYEARLFFMGLWNFADDCGHIEDEPLRLKLQILPNDVVDARALIETLIDAGLVKRLRGCLLINKFRKHQRIDKASTCRFAEDSTKPRRGSPTTPGTPASPRPGVEGKGGEGSGEEEPSSPAPQDDFEAFWISYPKRNGKRIGKAKALKVWKRLKTDERSLALQGVEHYGDACDKGLTIAKDAFRWLRDSEWVDWQDAAKAAGKPKMGETSPYLANAWGQQKSEPDPPCEHSDPMCVDCRRANIVRLKDLAESVGRSA